MSDYKPSKEEKEKSARLLAQEEQLSSLCETTQACIILHGLNSDIIEANSATQKLLGYTETELLSFNLSNLQPNQLRESDNDLAVLDVYKKSQVDISTAILVKKNGSRVPVEIKTTFIRFKNNGSYITVVQRVFYDKIAAPEFNESSHTRLSPNLDDREKFIQTTNRQLASPLNDVVSALKVFDRENLNSEQHNLLSLMTKSCDYLANTLKDIGDLYKLNTNTLELSEHKFNLVSVIGDVVELVTEESIKKSVDITCSIGNDISENAIADESRLQQILLKLVKISILLTENGSIKIEVNKTLDGRIRFEIIDTGKGIEASEYELLMSDFVANNITISRRYSDIALSYMLVRKLIALMGGSAGYSSLPEQGTLFWFSMDIADKEITSTKTIQFLHGKSIVFIDIIEKTRNQLQRQLTSWGADLRHFEEEQEAVNFLSGEEITTLKPNLILLNVHDTETTHAALMRSINQYLHNDNNFDTCDFVVITPGHFSPAAAHHFARIRHTHVKHPLRPGVLGNKLARLLKLNEPFPMDSSLQPVSNSFDKRYTGHIMIADDGKVTQMVVSALLTKVGFTVDCADNGLDAINAIESKHYDAILMDVQMPEMDGIEATARIRSLEKFRKHTPIIAITANMEDDVWRRCVHAGMDDYMTKPIDPHIMVATIEYLIGDNHIDKRNDTRSDRRKENNQGKYNENNTTNVLVL